MGESTKVVAAFVMMVSSVAAAIAWISDRPDQLVWGFRIGGLVLAFVALSLILALHFRSDIERDYLYEATSKYFNRDGFCFCPYVVDVDGIAHLEIFFQNQFESPCVGPIALRHGRGLLRGPVNFDIIDIEIDCGPAAYGVAQKAIPIPLSIQGKTHSFEVGAAVHYPANKDRRLRFRDGVFVRTNVTFGSKLETAITFAAALGGKYVRNKPTLVRVQLPAGVAAQLAEKAPPTITTYWKLGDVPLPAPSPAEQ